MFGTGYPGQLYFGNSASGLTATGTPPPVTNMGSPIVPTPFSYVITIGSSVVHIRPSSLHITDMLGQVQTAEFDVVDIHAAYTLDVNQRVSIVEMMTTIFTGDVDDVTLTSFESPYDIDVSGIHTGSPVGARLWRVRATGQSAVAFRNLTGVFSAEVKIPIQLVVSTLASNLGLASHVVVSGATVLPEYFLSDNETYASAFDRLADLATSESGVTHIWTIAPTVVTFSFVPTLQFGPVGFIGSSGASVGTTGYPAKAGTIQYRRTRQDFANTIIMKMDKHLQQGTQEEEFDFADIFQGTLKLQYPCAGQPTISVQGEDPQTVGIRDIDTGKDWYWNAGSPILRLGSSAVSAGETITVKYLGLDLRTVSVTNTSSVSAVGTFAIPAQMGDSGNTLNPLALAQSILARRLRSGSALRVVVKGAPPNAFVPGQAVSVNLPHLVSGTFFLRSIRHYDEEATVIWRELELLQGTLIDTGAQLMRRLSR